MTIQEPLAQEVLALDTLKVTGCDSSRECCPRSRRHDAEVLPSTGQVARTQAAWISPEQEAEDDGSRAEWPQLGSG
ncbi:hypothetical protein GCM10027020_21910 [Nocardioides salsibiostraticola]